MCALDLGAACTAVDEQVADQGEPSYVKQQIVDLGCEQQGGVVGAMKGGHQAASSMSSLEFTATGSTVASRARPAR